jgi:antirestriction protein
MTTTEVAPAIWVGCLACYNDGRLVGRWIEPDDYDEAEYRASLGACAAPWNPHEELLVMDHEGFGGLLSGECSPAEAVEVAEIIAKLPDYLPVEAFAAWVSNGGDRDDIEAFEDQFCGEWSSGEEYAEQFAADIGAIPDDENRWPLYCIDWERAWRDLSIDGMWTERASDGGVYVFDPNR